MAAKKRAADAAAAADKAAKAAKAKAEREARAEALRVKTRAEMASYAKVDQELYELTSRMLELSLQKGAHKATIVANAAQVQALVDGGDDTDGKGESIFDAATDTAQAEARCRAPTGIDPFQEEVQAALTAVPPADADTDGDTTRVLLVGFAHSTDPTCATPPGDIDLQTSRELFRRVVAVAKTAK